jgi:hypothetical protein
MKKTIFIMSLLLMSFIVYGGPPFPEPVVFLFTYDGQPLQFVDITLQYGSETITKETNEQGAIQIDIGSGSPDFDGTYSSLIVSVGDFTKTYAVSSLITPYNEKFEVSGLVPAPACPTCPPCNCGGGGSTYCTQSYCESHYPCEETVCETTTCPVCPTCPEVPTCTQKECQTICEETICPTDECTEQIIVDDGLSSGEVTMGIILILSALGIGGFGGAHLTRNTIKGKKNVSYRIRYQRDGDIVEEHRHPGIKSYHDPNTLHREEHERHKKGEKLPNYTKDEDGRYVYVG